MIVYYLSGDRKSRINLDQKPYWLQTGDFLDYSWTYNLRNNRIRSFKKEIAEHLFTISIFGATEEEYAANWKALHDVIDKDVRNTTPGRLYFGDNYLSCYLYGSENQEWENYDGLSDREMRLVTDYPHWIREEKKSFLAESSAAGSDYLEYPFDYAYDYRPADIGVETWSLGHFTTCEFLMIIYGPCVDPVITINGGSYQIYNTVEAGEYIVVDSYKHTVIKYLNNGTTQNLYDYRGKLDRSLFTPLPAGNLQVNWNGSFGFDITAYLERSEPEWS